MLIRIKNGFIEININDFITDEEYYEENNDFKTRTLLNSLKFF